MFGGRGIKAGRQPRFICGGIAVDPHSGKTPPHTSESQCSGGRGYLLTTHSGDLEPKRESEAHTHTHTHRGVGQQLADKAFAAPTHAEVLAQCLKHIYPEKRQTFYHCYYVLCTCLHLEGCTVVIPMERENAHSITVYLVA